MTKQEALLRLEVVRLTIAEVLVKIQSLEAVTERTKEQDDQLGRLRIFIFNLKVSESAHEKVYL